jgi:hypothetical protein
MPENESQTYKHSFKVFNNKIVLIKLCCGYLYVRGKHNATCHYRTYNTSLKRQNDKNCNRTLSCLSNKEYEQ